MMDEAIAAAAARWRAAAERLVEIEVLAGRPRMRVTGAGRVDVAIDLPGLIGGDAPALALVEGFAELLEHMVASREAELRQVAAARVIAMLEVEPAHRRAAP